MRSMNLQVLLINAWYHRTNTASFLHDLFTFYIYPWITYSGKPVNQDYSLTQLKLSNIRSNDEL